VRAESPTIQEEDLIGEEERNSKIPESPSLGDIDEIDEPSGRIIEAKSTNMVITNVVKSTPF
jgi:hypothetical protein